MEDAAQQILVPPGSLLVLIMLLQDLLHLGKCIFVYQWLMRPFDRDISLFHPGLAKIEAKVDTTFSTSQPLKIIHDLWNNDK